MAFQFKIQLKGITKPPVWRKVLVPDACTFADFHEIIQILFGWENYHLYQFSPKGYGSYPVLSDPDPDDWEPVDDAAKVKLKRYFKKVGDSFVYIYDFGDNWTHQIKLEAITPGNPQYPICIGWKGITPPEDCGGIHGYEEILNALKDPNDPDIEIFRESLGLEEGETWEEVNAFDIDYVNERLKIDNRHKYSRSSPTAGGETNILSHSIIEPPALHHPQVLAFYGNGLDIDQKLVAEIIQLPRQTLIEDMKTILQDSVDRMEVYIMHENNLKFLSAPIHALTVLSILKAEEELDFLLTYFHQPELHFDYWYGDIKDELLWHAVYALGENQPEKLWNFLLDTIESISAIGAIMQALSQMALHGSHPKETVRKWFEDFLNKLMEMPEGMLQTHKAFITYAFAEYMTIAGKENLPFIKKCYASGKIDRLVTGSLKELTELVTSGLYSEKKKRFTTLNEFYDGLNSMFGIGVLGEEEEEEEDWDVDMEFLSKYLPDHQNHFLDEIMKPLIAPDKIGRNDSCPCGSGKKYKKCCGNN